MSIALDAWNAGLEELAGRVAGRFPRHETRSTFRDILAGLLSELPNKNCWTLAEWAGHKTPHVMQHFLSRASWDDTAMTDDLRDYVIDHLGEVDALLVLDETGDLKKGVETVGVQRQYTGTAGRIENSQVAVYLGYGTTHGYTLIDRELYLPKSWATNPERREKAGVPADIEFATKAQLACALVDRFFDAGGTAAGLTGDEVYGDAPELRANCERRGLPYVLAIGCHRRLTTLAGRRRRADELVADLPKRRWHRLSAGDGAKGPRLYDWAWLRVDTDDPTMFDPVGGYRWLLARRNRTTGELAYYRCWSPTRKRLRALLRTAARRWSIETNFQHGKTLVGLDEHQVRTWRSWRRWTLLSMLALALLTTLTCHATDPTPPEPSSHTSNAGLIALTRNEIRHLIEILILRPVHTLRHTITWSIWRRHHQHQAKNSHYQRRSTDTT